MKTITSITTALALVACAFLFSPAICHAQSVLHFDGVDDYVDLGDSVGDGLRTIELWFKPTDTLDADSTFNFISLVARNTSGCGECSEFSLAFRGSTLGDSSRLQFRWRAASSSTLFQIFSDDNVWNAGQWYHVAGVLHPDSGMMMFVDGIRQADMVAAGTNPTTTSTFPTSIGRWGDANIRYFGGCIDDVRFSDTARYKEDFVPPCPDLINDSYTAGLWNFSDTSTTIAFDSSSNGFDGDIYGATRDSAWICESILCFDGDDDYVDLGSSVGDGVRTIELWFQPEDTIGPDSAYNFIALVARNTTGCQSCQEFSLAFTGSDVGDSSRIGFTWQPASAGTAIKVFSDGNIWNAGQWYHLAGVLHPDSGMMMFVDGIKQADIADNGTSATPSSSASTSIGRWGDAAIRYFGGCMDDVRFSDTARYKENFVPPCPDLINDSYTVGLYNMNKNSGIIAYDSSSNGYDGDIYGAVWEDPFNCGRLSPDQKRGITRQTAAPSETNSLHIYPNPGNGDMNYEFLGLGKDARMQVYAISGHLMKSVSIQADETGLAHGSIDLHHLKPGMYLIQVVSSNGRQTILYSRN